MLSELQKSSNLDFWRIQDRHVLEIRSLSESQNKNKPVRTSFWTGSNQFLDRTSFWTEPVFYRLELGLDQFLDHTSFWIGSNQSWTNFRTEPVFRLTLTSFGPVSGPNQFLNQFFDVQIVVTVRFVEKRVRFVKNGTFLKFTVFKYTDPCSFILSLNSGLG